MPRTAAKEPSNRRRSEDSRERIRQVAAKLFESSGYHATTMDHVAAAVGLNKATLYHYFKAKSDLLYELYEEAIDIGLEGVRGIDPDTPADVALANLIRYHVGTIATHRHVSGIYFQEMGWLSKWLPREQFAAIRKKEDEYSNFMTDLIERGIQEGTLVSDDPRVATFAIVGMLAWSHHWLRPKGRLTTDEVADRLLSLVFKGLEAPSRANGQHR
jgi:AcrR family transcriptional regulator